MTFASLLFKSPCLSGPGADHRLCGEKVSGTNASTRIFLRLFTESPWTHAEKGLANLWSGRKIKKMAHAGCGQTIKWEIPIHFFPANSV
jgi:hypothetical protein